MWPATGSIGSTSPRKRSAARASSTVAWPRRPRRASSASTLRRERRPIGVGRRAGDAARPARSSGRRRRAARPCRPPSSTATSAWPSQRSIHHSARRVDAAVAVERDHLRSPASMPSAPAVRAKTRAVGQRMAAVAAGLRARTGRGRGGRSARRAGGRRRRPRRRRAASARSKLVSSDDRRLGARLQRAQRVGGDQGGVGSRSLIRFGRVRRSRRRARRCGCAAGSRTGRRRRSAACPRSRAPSPCRRTAARRRRTTNAMPRYCRLALTSVRPVRVGARHHQLRHRREHADRRAAAATPRQRVRVSRRSRAGCSAPAATPPSEK